MWDGGFILATGTAWLRVILEGKTIKVQSPSKSSSAAIIGGVVAGVVCVAILTIIIVFLRRRRRRRPTNLDMQLN